jgi:gluconolactonase
VTGIGSGGTNAGNGGTGNGSGGSTGGTGGSGAGGSGGSGSTPAAPGRVGAELCPPGPFGSPLPATSVQKLASVGANDFFNWEGIVWNGSALFFSEITSNNSSQISRFTPGGNPALERGVVANTGSNGLALDAQGNLLLASHGVGGISRVQLPGGALTPGSQTFNGLRFNSPNDLVLRGDGNIYFTDPDFQSPSGRIQGSTRVYRIAPADVPGTGTISVVDDTFSNPNGITLSPDGNRLYVSGGSVLREYSLDSAGAATRVGDFSTSLQVPDGMTVDCAGNIYAVENSARQIRVFSPAGALLGTIGPNGFDNQGLTNVAFGGADRKTLFISSSSQMQQGGLYSVQLNVPGLPY